MVDNEACGSPRPTEKKRNLQETCSSRSISRRRGMGGGSGRGKQKGAGAGAEVDVGEKTLTEEGTFASRENKRDVFDALVAIFTPRRDR